VNGSEILRAPDTRAEEFSEFLLQRTTLKNKQCFYELQFFSGNVLSNIHSIENLT